MGSPLRPNCSERIGSARSPRDEGKPAAAATAPCFLVSDPRAPARPQGPSAIARHILGSSTHAKLVRAGPRAHIRISGFPGVPARGLFVSLIHLLQELFQRVHPF